MEQKLPSVEANGKLEGAQDGSYEPGLKSQPHELWRQDDNGNRFMIAKYPCWSEAVSEMDILASRQHKQTYWVEKSR